VSSESVGAVTTGGYGAALFSLQPSSLLYVSNDLNPAHRCGVATLSTDAITAAMDAETADVALAQSGDGRAFERLYRTHVPRVLGLVRRMLDGTHADDVTQDVFVRAWEKLHTFRGEAAFGTWLHRLAVNVILARRKTLGGERRRFYEDGEVLEQVAGRVETHEHGLDFEDAISRLPEGARQVFLLHDVQGFRHEEIAKLLGIVPGTSKSQLHHARMALRKYLDR
jgi:RNA polymerase sigma factor (sigma-70 family)